MPEVISEQHKPVSSPIPIDTSTTDLHNRHSHYTLSDARARQRLIARLQTSLELEAVLTIFLEELRHWIHISGLKFIDESRQDIHFGTIERHECDYQLICEGRCLGNIIFSRTQRFTDKQLSNLESLISLLLYPLKNSLSYKQALAAAFIDPLTGIGNRASLDRAMHRELQMAHRHGDELSVLVLDLDHFKRVNDLHGHSAGDQVLKTVASSLQQTCRETDRIFRYGGEEFLVLLPKTNQFGARVIAERLRQTIAQLSVRIKKTTIQPTISIGIASLKPMDKACELFDRADQALYVAKSAGRNCVSLAE